MPSTSAAVVNILVKRFVCGSWFLLLWLHVGRTMILDVWLWGRLHIEVRWPTDQIATR